MNNFKILILVFIIIILYFVSIFNFILNIDNDFIFSNKVNNVVILTGNKGRLQAGLNLMESNINSRMLISGVAKGVKHSDIITNVNIENNRIRLGYNANNTLGNAIETANWVKEYNINNFILITDNWHMQRTLLLFNSLMPNIEILPYALNSISSDIKDYLKFNNKTFLIFKEHLKFLISHIQVLYLWLFY